MVIFFLSAASTLFAQDFKSLMGMGDALYKKGDYRNAAAYYEQGLALAKSKAPGENVIIALIDMQLGLCYAHMNNFNNALFSYFDAVSRAKKAIVTDRNEATKILFGAYGSILDIYDQEELTGPMRDITDQFIAFIQEYNKSPLPEDVIAKAEVDNFLAYCWAQNGENLDRALVLIDEALKSEPKSYAMLDTKGWVLLKMGKNDEAKKVLTDAVELCKKAGDSCSVIERHLTVATGGKR